MEKKYRIVTSLGDSQVITPNHYYSLWYDNQEDAKKALAIEVELMESNYSEDYWDCWIEEVPSKSRRNES